MNQWEFSFEASPWETVFETLPAGGSFSAARFLAMMEGETEDSLAAAFEALEKKDILLDISELPKNYGSGELALRLRREEQLVRENALLQNLEENDPLRLYLEELAAIPVTGDPQVLAQKCAEGDEAAMAQLVNAMLSRVVTNACQMTGRGVLLMDLIQEGSLGLWQAILTYTQGSIETHCDRCIQITLANSVVRQALANGVGQKMRQALEDYRAIDERLLTELGRNPTLEEIALELHMTPEEASFVAETLDAARMLQKAKADSEPKEQQPEDEQAVEDTAYFQMRQRIQELLSSLNEADAKLLTLRFGLEGGLPMSPEDTGKQLGLTPEEVVAREAAALNKLRNA